MTQTTLTEEQIKEIMPEFGDYGEKVVGKATLYRICDLALDAVRADITPWDLASLLQSHIDAGNSSHVSEGEKKFHVAKAKKITEALNARRI